MIDRDAQRKVDQWFRENEKRFLEEIRAKREQKIREQQTVEEQRRLEELRRRHWMHCPKCGQDMAEQDLQGIKVDICSGCEGIFFDRGELETLVAKKAEERRGFFRRLVGLGD